MSDKYRDVIEDTEDELHQFGLAASVELQLYSEQCPGYSLALKRIKKQGWRLVIENEWTGTVPLIDCSEELQEIALKHLPQLRALIHEKARCMCDEIREVCDEVYRVLRANGWEPKAP